ncbi:hypothetical protein Tsubulata_044459 [Turnera subulata]|uniref:glycerol-3-phosphate dehydrogenase n=1 Tax=Turnera subulata TaxID=218843 RepID=A0A9Q0JHI1_9ROSI|nr:hypothetical protein Tsubulata_044459 [Turnera subulata]
MLARNGKDKMLVWYNFRGTVVYYDGQMNDSRLNVGLACTAALAGKEFETYAKVVVNAAGPFCDAVRRMVDKDAKPMIGPSSGVHIVLPSYYFPERILGLLRRTVAGTTDSNTVITQLPVPHKDEIQFILDAISDYLTLKREWPWLGRTFAGTTDSNTVITQLAEPHEDEIIFQLRRLSIELPKADKVLVDERVIESFGLQTVRFPWLEEKRSEEFLVAKESVAGLGINVPERVNPPDHFIDILEGIVTPSASSGVNHGELPI